MASRGAVTGALAGRALKWLGQIRAMTAEGESDHLPTYVTDYAARRMTVFKRLRAISPDCVTRAGTVVPRAQCGE